MTLLRSDTLANFEGAYFSNVYKVSLQESAPLAMVFLLKTLETIENLQRRPPRVPNLSRFGQKQLWPQTIPGRANVPRNSPRRVRKALCMSSTLQPYVCCFSHTRKLRSTRLGGAYALERVLWALAYARTHVRTQTLPHSVLSAGSLPP